MNPLRVGDQWRHVKTGDVYTILETGVLMQCSTYQEFENVVGLERWVVYSKPNDHRRFMRLEKEFLDGRFQLVRLA
jgi:hypothetical protein